LVDLYTSGRETILLGTPLNSEAFGGQGESDPIELWKPQRIAELVQHALEATNDTRLRQVLGEINNGLLDTDPQKRHRQIDALYQARCEVLESWSPQQMRDLIDQAITSGAVDNATSAALTRVRSNGLASDPTQRQAEVALLDTARRSLELQQQAQSQTANSLAVFGTDNFSKEGFEVHALGQQKLDINFSPNFVSNRGLSGTVSQDFSHTNIYLAENMQGGVATTGVLASSFVPSGIRPEDRQRDAELLMRLSPNDRALLLGNVMSLTAEERTSALGQDLEQQLQNLHNSPSAISGNLNDSQIEAILRGHQLFIEKKGNYVLYTKGVHPGSLELSGNFDVEGRQYFQPIYINRFNNVATDKAGIFSGTAMNPVWYSYFMAAKTVGDKQFERTTLLANDYDMWGEIKMVGGVPFVKAQAGTMGSLWEVGRDSQGREVKINEIELAADGHDLSRPLRTAGGPEIMFAELTDPETFA
jgi:hypothetical protein